MATTSAKDFQASLAEHGADEGFGVPSVICRLPDSNYLVGETDVQPPGGSHIGIVYFNQGAASLVTDGPVAEAPALLRAIPERDRMRDKKRYTLVWALEKAIHVYTLGLPGVTTISVEGLKAGWQVFFDAKGCATVEGYNQAGGYEERKGNYFPRQ